MLLNRLMPTNVQFFILIICMVLELKYLGVKWHRSLYLFFTASGVLQPSKKPYAVPPPEASSS